MGEPKDYEQKRKPASLDTHRDGSAYEPKPRPRAYEDYSPEARDRANTAMLNADRADAVVDRTPHEGDEVAAPEATTAPREVEEKRTEVGAERATSAMTTVSAADDAFAAELDGLIAELVEAATAFSSAATATVFGGRLRDADGAYASVASAADMIGLLLARKPPLVERSSARGAFYRTLDARLKAGVARATPKIRTGARQLNAAATISPQLIGDPKAGSRARSTATECEVIARKLSGRRVEVTPWTPRA